MTGTRDRVYLDYNATAPLLAEARTALIEALAMTGNPSSVHREGRQARALVEAARRDVAALVGASSEAVVFTAGATEAAATCLTPHWRENGALLDLTALAVSETDHPCTWQGGRFPAERVIRLPVDRDGRMRMDALNRFVETIAAGEVAMVCVALANGETGVVENFAALREIVRTAAGRIVLVLDASQAAGRMPLDIVALGADALILSGHKIGAAKGIGAFILRDPALRPVPLTIGGGQELGRRAGTEAVAMIASFGAAAKVAASRSADDLRRLRGLRDRMISAIDAAELGAVLIGRETDRLVNTVTIAATALRGETAQIAMDLAGFAVSSGSACASGKVGESRALRALQDAGLDIDAASGAIRISFGFETGDDEIERGTAALLRILGAAKMKTLALKAA